MKWKKRKTTLHAFKNVFIHVTRQTNLVQKILSWNSEYIFIRSRVSRACEPFHDNSVSTLSRLLSRVGAQLQPSLAVIFCKRGSSRGIGFTVNHCGRHAGKVHQRPALGEIEIVPNGIETALPISILRRRARNYRDR